MKLWDSIQDLNTEGNGKLEIKGNTLTITDENQFRGELIDTLVLNAVFNDNSDIRDLARWVIWEGSQNLGCPSASIQDLYKARASDAWTDATVPAINVRSLTYDVARTIFKTLQKTNASACIFEIAKSEIGYTEQRPAEYTSCVLAAALREGWNNPVFIQGDHFQANAKKFTQDPHAVITELKGLIDEAVSGGFYNIDIDTSTLVDLSKPTTEKQQQLNFEVAAELTKHIRSIEPKGITISVGGEIGEVGSQNSTPEELVAYVEGYEQSLDEGLEGISKISIQTGTSHGGVPLPDGTIAKVALDFKVIAELGDICRKKFGIGGVVQHGASTLPESAFDNFPKNQAMEVHLATGFQNTILDSKSLPKDLKAKIYQWLDENCASEKKEGQTSEQFYYKTRKKALGPFKKELWSLPGDIKAAIMGELGNQFEMLFTKLGIAGKKDLIKEYVKPVAVHRPLPQAGEEPTLANIEVDNNPNAD